MCIYCYNLYVCDDELPCIVSAYSVSVIKTAAPLTYDINLPYYIFDNRSNDSSPFSSSIVCICCFDAIKTNSNDDFDLACDKIFRDINRRLHTERLVDQEYRKTMSELGIVVDVIKQV